MNPNWLSFILIGFAGGGILFAGIGYALANRFPYRRSAPLAALVAGGTVLVLGTAGKAQAAKIGEGVFILTLALGLILAFSLFAGFFWSTRVWKEGRRSPSMTLICTALSLTLLILLKVKFAELGFAVQELGLDNAPKKIEAKADQGSADNLKSLYFAFETYTQDWDGLPPADHWMDNEDLVSKITKNEWLHSPTVSNRNDDKFGYAYHAAVAGRKLNGKKLKEMPEAAQTPLLFESSDLSKSAKGDLSLLPKPGRNNGKNYILYCDGSVKAQ